VIAGWLVGTFSLDAITDDGNLQVSIAFGLLVATGLLIGRWWLLAVPAVGAIGLLIYGGIAPSSDCATCRDEIPFVGWVFILLLYVTLADIGLGAGIGLRRLLVSVKSSGRRHRPDAAGPGPRPTVPVQLAARHPLRSLT
jgi:hypothetical protein